jgi:hypothetical protein
VGQRIRYVDRLVDVYPEEKTWQHLYLFAGYLESDPGLSRNSFPYAYQLSAALPPQELARSSVSPPKDMLAFLIKRIKELEGA